MCSPQSLPSDVRGHDAPCVCLLLVRLSVQLTRIAWVFLLKAMLLLWLLRLGLLLRNVLLLLLILMLLLTLCLLLQWRILTLKMFLRQCLHFLLQP